MFFKYKYTKWIRCKILKHVSPYETQISFKDPNTKKETITLVGKSRIKTERG